MKKHNFNAGPSILPRELNDYYQLHKEKMTKPRKQ